MRLSILILFIFTLAPSGFVPAQSLRSHGGPCVSCGNFISEGEYHDFIGCAGLRSGPNTPPVILQGPSPTELRMRALIRDVDDNGRLYNQNSVRAQKLYHLQRMAALLDEGDRIIPGDSRVYERREQVAQLLEAWHANARRRRIASQLEQAGHIRNAVLGGLADMNANAIKANAATDEIDSLINELQKNPSGSVNDVAPVSEPHSSPGSRTSAGRIHALRGEVWAGMIQAPPHLDTSVVDLRDARTLTIDPGSLRASARNSGRVRRSLTEALRKKLDNDELDLAFKKIFRATLDEEWEEFHMEEAFKEIFRETLELQILRNLADDYSFHKAIDEAIQELDEERERDELSDRIFLDNLLRAEEKDQGQGLLTAGSPRPLSNGGIIYSGDAIATGPDSHLQVIFDDDSVFTIAPNSQFSLNNFAYNRNAVSNGIAADLTEGAIRFVSGSIAHGDSNAMKIHTPTGNVIPRGTEVLLTVDSRGASQIAVFSGTAQFTPDDDSTPFVLIPEGHFVEISRKGRIGSVLAVDALGLTQSAALYSRAPARAILEAVFWPAGLTKIQLLAKATLVLLGLTALFGWIWELRQRRLTAMIAGAFVGISLITISAWLF